MNKHKGNSIKNVKKKNASGNKTKKKKHGSFDMSFLNPTLGIREVLMHNYVWVWRTGEAWSMTIAGFDGRERETERRGIELKKKT